MTPEPIVVTLLVVQALESLHVSYLIGGSMAAALHGVPRATNDADLVVDLNMEQVDPFVDAVTPAFYADAHSIREAVRDKRSFNMYNNPPR